LIKVWARSSSTATWFCGRQITLASAASPKRFSSASFTAKKSSALQVMR
jgi:hypothetical protein